MPHKKKLTQAEIEIIRLKENAKARIKEAKKKKVRNK